MYVYVWPHVMYISSRDSSCILDFSTSTSVHMNVLPVCAPHVGYMYVHVQVTSYKLQVTSTRSKKICYYLLLLLSVYTNMYTHTRGVHMYTTF
jgi:hypothetical protein